MIDGDAVPRRGFVARCARARSPGWFLGSKRLELSRKLERARARRARTGPPLVVRSLARASGSSGVFAALTPRDRRRPGRDGLPEFVPHGNRYGFLLGVFRDDFERVNGFDMRYEGWGEEDVDLAVRLHRLGLRCGWPGPQGTLLHLWHESRKDGPRPNAAPAGGDACERPRRGRPRPSRDGASSTAYRWAAESDFSAPFGSR